MRVHVENDIYIAGDKLSFTVEKKVMQKRKDKETGEVKEVEAFEVVGNFGSLSGAINFCTRLKIVDSKATTMAELLEELKAIRAHIENIVLI